MQTHVFIDGEQGTTGLQIRARLQARPDLHLLTLPEAVRKDPAARAEALNRAHVAILCLPDDAAREAVAMIENPRVRVIDASSAHRTAPGWTYGFAELQHAQARAIAGAARVSNPGCYPTGALALVRPLVDAGLLPADAALAIHAVSGYSGRGRAGVDAFEGPGGTSAPAFQVYGLALAHKHAPEIQHHGHLAERPLFVPAYDSFRQGIVLTVPLHVRQLAPGASGTRLHEALAEHFAGQRHVQVLPPAEAAALTHLDPQALNGRDDLRLMVFDNPQHGQVLLAAVFDNLGKGAAGAAVQNLDLMISG
ncbi:N-acetyl-gamma-glutamyl-phosphate reductase [Pseudorhodoferax sp.]|uniref:N-acetyl-gamma-glutamyl-phosphate reductase n=1 Tax=Pseudorhodoferax sp. TaxID=1993553 RepID=UPI002DD6212C|nr:N-acetyl-gamma-glutamyl-phosphate reductase [Pseudorhodoferax sp.]